ncbi:hypothetical protein DACRYDRAFT_20514 [Dacryopinax primogenitus]|uniref:Succinate dehydrogenase cytochrome b560 subunit n=1 Tax=Dacryopinax primogenitus (strain DJM 731) TaxID=1858805 RepID=M5GG62_DACPD|nr:uncharacterized protein DACRYDRAFT_20514 [Dacryopinax primogenitus]EJU04933.1 hypothetical protein DACRYDRAFT_20514 [Dacryopinax primogenitus]
MFSTAVVGMRVGLRSAAGVSRMQIATPAMARSRLSALARRASPMLTRSVQVQSMPPAGESVILNTQRLKRPSSPHFTIYQPQLTWVASIFHRVTGVGLSLALYAFAIGYLASPVIGIPLDSASVVEFVHGLPEWFKLTTKAIFAYPFVFHSLNGVRHLVWDSGYFLTVKGAYSTGYTVLGLTALLGTAVLFI